MKRNDVFRYIRGSGKDTLALQSRDRLLFYALHSRKRRDCVYEGGPIIQQPFLLGGSSGLTFYPLNVSALVRYPVETHVFPKAIALQAFLTIFLLN